MKKIVIIAVVLFSVNFFASAQKGNAIEVLYFKANLACCKAKSCNALEADVQKIVSENFKDGSVVFKEVKLADEANKELVEKYKAQSQTVVIVKKKKKKETAVDVSELMKNYLQTQDKEALQKQFLAKVEEVKKK
ncbi:MAG: hypothetical protein A2275_12115 [Bacteroidetes bacterium RIFOXYA12_FULL_35_11]|nr:MAG: hypothetical protein A2X01_12985 [Bacteroidetes bacterium GWF2_35_48]OFY73633.1 MAG: hypothetical protein A2275_12115 [Bacteroidetes bacterium RIFOXYA12_FULL_35_11]OFY94261.1 MAG: hypothetical protein A2491_18195 [Bacteroidetes bacterium RIFOXYC12_FULL_35_7]OFY94615.1 MAG: hypothetical protein A2309_08485 [Bacteroidetes bacterium RIFOXYB2_FULL_35_7]HBX52399.1 hypothetical protein [Bacteroidales bacterium]